MTKSPERKLVVSALFTDRPYNIYPAPTVDGWEAVFFSNSTRIGSLATARGWKFCHVNFPEIEGDYIATSLQSKWVKFLQFLHKNDLTGESFFDCTEVIYFDHKFWIQSEHIESIASEKDAAAILIRETPAKKLSIQDEVAAARTVDRYKASMPETEEYIARKVDEGYSMDFRICNTGLIHYRRPSEIIGLADDIYKACMSLNQPECQIFWALHAQDYSSKIRTIAFNEAPIKDVTRWDPVEIYGLPDHRPGLAIAGFHRSGTSALTGFLHASGLNAGNDLMDGNEFNKKGHFESWTIVCMHDRIMQAAGNDWATPLSQKVDVSLNDIEEMRKYARLREGNGQYWVMKDPRIGRFLKEWKQAVPSLKFLVVYRDPSASIHSLQRRSMQLLMRSGGTSEIDERFVNDPDLGPVLWRDHNQALLDLVEAYPEDCVVLGQPSIMNNFDIVTLLNERFGFDVSKPQVNVETLDRSLITQDPPPVYVQSEDLMISIQSIWERLCDLDAAGPEEEVRTIARRKVLFDQGGSAKAQLLQIQVDEAYRMLRSKEVHHILKRRPQANDKTPQATTNSINPIPKNHAETEEYRHAAVTIAKKTMKPPFSWYFKRRKKYRAAGSLILRNDE